MNQPTYTTKPGDPQASKTEAEAIADIARQGVKAQSHPHPDGLPFVVAPAGHQVVTLPLRELPNRHSGTVSLHDAASFCEYVKRFTEACTSIYASEAPTKLVAVLNEHEPTCPDWRDWRAVYMVPASREWQTWTKANRQQMSQLAFAEFLEDNLPDIAAPDSTSLLEMVLAFEATKGGAFKSVQRLQSGDVNFAYVDEVTGGGAVKMPPKIALNMPVFERGEPYAVDARLKYRIKDGGLSLWYELVRPHVTSRQAFDAMISGVVARTGIPVWMGEP